MTRERPWLFKPATRKDGHVQGEDWVEKVSYEIGTRLGVPCARVELCQRNGIVGSLSQDLRPTNWEMQPGSVLISEIVGNYESRTKTRHGHSLTNVKAVLASILAPPGLALPAGYRSLDVFAGFLVMDALIANQDRHDENWSVLRPPPGDTSDTLSGSYDHASALGFGLTDARRAHILHEPGIEVWANRGYARKFEHNPGSQLKLVDLAAHALSMSSAGTRDHWKSAVENLTPNEMGTLIEKVPDLHPQTVDFTTRLLSVNRQRILDEC